MNVSDLLAEPAVGLAVAAVIVLAYHYIKGMPYPEFVFWTQVKHRIALILETTNLAELAERFGLRVPGLRKLSRFIASIRLTKTKQYREDDEYVATVARTPKELARAFGRAGIDQHMIAGSKRRETPDGMQWAHTQWAYQHDDGKQTEVWLYTNATGSTDIYAHREDTVFDPSGHLSVPFTPGDPEGVLDPVLADA